MHLFGIGVTTISICHLCFELILPKVHDVLQSQVQLAQQYYHHSGQQALQGSGQNILRNIRHDGYNLLLGREIRFMNSV